MNLIKIQNGTSMSDVKVKIVAGFFLLLQSNLEPTTLKKHIGFSFGKHVQKKENQFSLMVKFS